MTRKIPIISLEDFEAKAKKPLMMKTFPTEKIIGCIALKRKLNDDLVIDIIDLIALVNLILSN